MYESLLQSSFLVRLLVSVIPALLVVIPLAYIAQKQEVVNRDDDNVMTTAMRFVGAAFILLVPLPTSPHGRVQALQTQV
jgi:hypothetical protein